jgi:outer membrane protein insertion porin family
MRNVIKFFIIINAFLILNDVFSAPSRYEGMIIRKIEFSGIKNVDPDDLKAEIESTEIETGFPLKASEVRKAIKLVFDKGQFEDVSVEVEEYQDGVQLKFVCKERPMISDIEFKGLKEKSSVDFEGIIPVKEGDFLKINLLESSIKIIKNKYKEEGFYNSVINYKINKKEKENTVEVVFVVDEGEEIKVEKISILGAKKIKEKNLIGAMETEEDGVFKDGKFNSDIYEQDKGKVLAYYKERGYLDAQIVEDKVEYEWVNPEKKEDRGIFITIKVTEGGIYYFDKYSISGNKVFTTKELFDKFEQTDSGKVFNDTKFQMDRQSISFAYASKGYIFARVSPIKTIEEREKEIKGKKVKQKFVSYNFQIEEGTQAYLENIIIKGNKKTKDKVIRREVLVKEGELFNASKVQISREKIFNLGFFKQVNIDIRPGSKEGFMNLIVDVEEQPTGTISLGGGWGTNSGFSIFADIGENNLFGNGQRIGFKIQYGPKSRAYTISFSEPWLLNYPVNFSTSIFYMQDTITRTSMFSNTNESAEYQSRRIGYTLGLNYRFPGTYFVVGNKWTHSFRSIVDPSGNNPDDIFLEQAYGVQESRTLMHYIYYDSKNNYMNPTRGGRAEFSIGMTGGILLRGSDHYLTYEPGLYYYYNPFHLPFLKSHPCVFEFRANGTFLAPPFARNKVEKFQSPDDNPWLKADDMLFLGGTNTLRGWDIDDSAFPDSWRNRLYHRITYGTEFRVPVQPDFFWLVLFFDAGSLWTDSYWEGHRNSETERKAIQTDKDNNQLYDIRDFFHKNKMPYFKYAWGFGFKLQIPMMPLRFYFGRKVDWVGKDKGFFRERNKDFNIQFGIGDAWF